METQNNNTSQLTFDFSAKTKNILRKSPIISPRPTNSFVYRADASTIMADRFAIKGSYLSRSYLVKWSYGIKEIRSFWNLGEITRDIWFIRYDSIEYFLNGKYIRTFLLAKDEARIKKEVEHVLKDANYNQNLAVHHHEDIHS